LSSWSAIRKLARNAFEELRTLVAFEDWGHL